MTGHDDRVFANGKVGPPAWVTIAEAQLYFGYSRDTIYIAANEMALAGSGVLKHGHWRIDLAAMTSYFEAGARRAAAQSRRSKSRAMSDPSAIVALHPDNGDPLHNPYEIPSIHQRPRREAS